MATTLSDLEAELAEVNAAISRITQATTQKHGTGDDSHEAPDLGELFRERRRLRKEIDALSAGSAVVRRNRVI